MLVGEDVGKEEERRLAQENPDKKIRSTRGSGVLYRYIAVRGSVHREIQSEALDHVKFGLSVGGLLPCGGWGRCDVFMQQRGCTP